MGASVGKGLSLDIAMNTRDVIKGAGDIEGALDDVAGTLDDVAREGDQAAEKLERSFSEAMREISADSRRGGDDLARNIDRGTTHARESLRELKGEALQNVAETLSSTDGSLQSFADGVQGTMGGVVAGLSAINPAAAAVAGGAALGFGLVTAELVRQEEATKKLRERYSGLYKEALEDSRTFLSEAQVQAEVMDLMWNPERAGEYTRAQEDAKTLGLDLIDVLKAQAGDQKALNDVLAVSNTLYAESAEKAAARWTAQGGNVQAGIQAEAKSLEGLRDRYQQISDVQQDNQQKAEESHNILDRLRKEERDQIKLVRAADQDRYEALAAAQQKAANPPPIVQQLELDTDRLERDFARWRRRFTTGSGAKLTIVADVVDRYGRRVD